MSALNPHTWLRRVIPLTVGILALSEASARDPGFGVAQPTNYFSRSGTHSLLVDPSDRNGRGGATYRFSRARAEVKIYEKPYTLREVTVTDRGFVTGFAYRENQAHEKFLHIVILDQDGQELLNETEERQLAHMHGPTVPEVIQVLVDEQNDRLIVRVRARSEQLFSYQQLRTYQLSTGKSMKVLDLKAIMDIVDGLLVPETPLVLLHTLKKGPDPKARDYGAAFVLVDPEEGEIWTFEADDDYANLDLQWIPYGGPRFFDRHSAISTSGRGHFEIRLFAGSTRVAFGVDRAESGWKVIELGRADAPIENDAKPDSGIDAAFPPLVYLGEFIPDGTGSASPLSGLWDFTFDSQARIYVVRKSADNAMTMGLLNENGAIVNERPLSETTLAGMGRHWIDVPQYKDDRYYQFKKEGESDYSAWSVHLPTGREERVKNYPGGIASSITRLSDGGLVMLEMDVRQSALAYRLRCFDPEGKLRWELDSDASNDHAILGMGPKHVSVTTQDNVVLLSFSSIHIIDRDGKHLKKIDLRGAFGNAEFGGSPGYLHDVVADTEGGFLVADHKNPPVVLRYSGEGSLRSMWSPRHADGKTFDLQPKIRVSPDGRLWTGDGKSIMRLTDDGVVDLVIGQQPSADQLGEIVAFTVDGRGNLYAVAHGTAAIHVFDSAHKPIRIIKPDPADVHGTVKESFVAVNDNGEVFLKKPATQVFMPPDEYLRFSATGESLGTITFEPSIPVGRFLSPCWAFQPNTNYRCGVCAIRGDTRLVLVNPPDTMIREQRKRPNGRWFGHWTNLAVAPDGSIVVLDHDIFSDQKVYELDFFSAHGDPIRTVRLPSSADRYSGLAYDGAKVAVFGKKDAVFYDLRTETIDRRALVDPAVAENEWAAFLTPKSNEILLFDRTKHKVHRYEWPAQPGATP